MGIRELDITWKTSDKMPQSSMRFSSLEFKHPTTKSHAIIVPEYIDCGDICKEELSKLNRSQYTIHNKDTSAGRFYFCNQRENANGTLFGQSKAGITLHTMTRSLVNTPNLMHWMQFYKERGVNEFIFCINTPSVQDYLDSKSFLKEISSNITCVVYHIPFAHRYKPNFESCDYVGSAKIIKDFVRFSPANFHNIQHISIQISAHISDYDYLLHCDTDEYLDANLVKERALLEANDSSAILYENCWCLYLPVSTKSMHVWMLLKNNYHNPAPARSKYLCRIKDINYFGIHYAMPICGNAIVSTIPLYHIWNLSDRRVEHGRIRNSKFSDHNPKLPDDLSYKMMLEWTPTLLRLQS